MNPVRPHWLALISVLSACSATAEPVNDLVRDQVVDEPGDAPPPGDEIPVGRGSPTEVPPLHAPYAGLVAGAAVESIDPALDGAPIYLGGYGGRLGPATALDPARPLTVRALAFRDEGDHHAVMIALDVVGLDALMVSTLRRAAAQATWLPEETFTFTTTHTHTAPVSRPFPVWDPVLQNPDSGWMNGTLIPATLRAVSRALTGMQPADLRWATAQVPMHGRWLPCGNRHGLPYYDRTVDVLEARTLDGGPIATAFFHGCHPVTMGGTTTVSADWPADARARVEERRGGIAIFFQGFGGDVDPVGATPRADDGKLASEIGGWIGGTVVSALTDGEAHPITGRIELRRGNGSLALQHRTTLPKVLGPAVQKRWEHLMSEETSLGTLEKGLPMEVSSIRLGSLRIVTTSHEMIGEWGPRVRALFPDEHVMLVGYTNGVDSYIPDDKMVLDRSDHNYEGNVSFYLYGHPGPFAKGADSSLLSLVRTMNERPGGSRTAVQ